MATCALIVIGGPPLAAGRLPLTRHSKTHCHIGRTAVSNQEKNTKRVTDLAGRSGRTRAVDTSDLLGFLRDANQHGYAAGRAARQRQESDHSTTVTYEAGEWFLHDNSLGGRARSGPGGPRPGGRPRGAPRPRPAPPGVDLQHRPAHAGASSRCRGCRAPEVLIKALTRLSSFEGRSRFRT